MVRGLRCVLVERGLLNPAKHGFFALQLFSHKVLLRTAVFPLSVLALTSSLLWSDGWVYRAAAIAQGSLYALGAAGLLLRRRPIGKRRLLALPAYFCLMHQPRRRRSDSSCGASGSRRGRRTDRPSLNRRRPPPQARRPRNARTRG